MFWVCRSLGCCIFGRPPFLKNNFCNNYFRTCVVGGLPVGLLPKASELRVLWCVWKYRCGGGGCFAIRFCFFECLICC